MREEWTNEQREWIWKMKHPTDGSVPPTYEDLVPKFKKVFGIERSHGTLQTQVSAIKRGVAKLDIDAPVRTRNAQYPAQKWSEEEDAILQRVYVQEGGNEQDVRDAIQSQLGIERTSKSVKMRIYSRDITRVTEAGEAQPSKIFRKSSLGSIVDRIQRHDSEEFFPALEARTEYVLGLMKTQADAIRAYDSFAQFRGIDLTGLMKLDTDERKRVAAFLRGQDAMPKIDDIRLIAVPGCANGNRLNIILPVYAEDVEISKEGLGSALNDMTAVALPRDKRGDPFYENFRGLVRYNLVSRIGVDYEPIAGSITSALQEEHQGVIVSIFEDLFLRERGE